MNFVFLGLSLSSSWGNGHATTYRGLIKALHARGHRVLFLERNQSWYEENRDLSEPEYCELAYYESTAELQRRFYRQVREADAVIVGSYVADGIAVGQWATRIAEGIVAFYDIDTPVTLAELEAGSCTYLSAKLIPRFDLYLSFTGGPILDKLEADYGAKQAVAYHCSADPEAYSPKAVPAQWDLGYLGTYSQDRQPALERLLLRPARQLPEFRFTVIGPQYPAGLKWPANVARREHLEPKLHAGFYRSQRYTLNITRGAMVRAGYSPSVRLFEAAACGTPIISDAWDGLESFFEPGREILVARTSEDVRRFVCEISEKERRAIGRLARARFLREHTAAHRAAQLENLVKPAGLRSEAAAPANVQEIIA